VGLVSSVELGSDMHKGDLVRINLAKCFTVERGGQLSFPLSTYGNDKAGVVESARPVTPEETSEWYASDVSKGLNDAGESKLPPQSRYVPLHRDRVYTVVRARARVRLGWGNAQGGYTKILCTVTGEETYIKRDLLEVI